MKYKVFDVVRLKDGNNATILKIQENQYFVEIVTNDGITIDKRLITKDEIIEKIYTKD